VTSLLALTLAAGNFELPVSHDAMRTLVVAIAAGIFLIVIARQLSLPSIVLLLLGGVVLGPECLGVVQPESLGALLPVIVSLAVGLILFEGGLTLDLRGYISGSKVIPRLLTVGVVTTWLGTSLVVALLFDVTPSFALLAGSLVIVTGPTVIAPLLKRIKVKQRLHDILHWEGVMIDPIGVFIALLCYEWIIGRDGGLVFGNFAWRAVSGTVLGIVGGWAIVQAFRWQLVPRNLANAFALGGAMAIFGVAETVISEAGLLAVTVAGFVVGWLQPAELKQIRQFKAEITDLLVGLLFIVLAGRLQLDQFTNAGVNGLLAVAAILFVIRPVNIALSTWGTGLSFREKLFLSWVAPRGIVAASMASLFALGLKNNENLVADPQLIETLTYSTIVATVILQGFSAGWVARLLGLKRPDPTGWMIAGASAINRRIARFLRDEAKLDVLLIDTNSRLIAEARRGGIPAICEDARNVDLVEERVEFLKVGHLLALTDNTELNELLCQRWGDALDIHESVYRWSANRDQTSDDRGQLGDIAFPGTARPTVLSAELVDGEARVWSATSDGSEIGGVPLVIFRKGTARPVTNRKDSDKIEKGDRVLVLERDAGFLSRSLQAGSAVDLAATDLHHLYEQILEIAVELVPSISKDESLSDITQPGKLVPNLIGHGIAIPHLYNRNNPHRLCIFARLPDGLELPGEPEPIRLVFFLISPAGDPEGHLATLAEIARFCGDQKNRDRLLSLESIDQARMFLQSRSR
jgi:NhaP-type Na+/H+ or K+/H+ antiporter/mannitol/fructose-specific phosphotransferase system IIA component (Ntr-type)